MKIEKINFKGRKIRRVWYMNKWYFSIIDIISALTETERPRKYWSDLKSKLISEGSELSEKIGQLKMKAEDGKLRSTDVLNTEQLFRLVQSIPSKKVEPFKLWLARVGRERVEENIDPEISINRALRNYLKKGYSEKWVNQRLKSIEVRKELTNEWVRTGVDREDDFAILTNDLIELVLNMLAEATTTEFSKKENPEYFEDIRSTSIRGGNVAGVARRKIEKELRENVVPSKNAFDLIEKDEKKKKNGNIKIKKK